MVQHVRGHERSGKPVRPYDRSGDSAKEDSGVRSVSRKDRLAAPGEGGTRSLYAYYYEMAPSYGIFDTEKKEKWAEKQVETATGEIDQQKENIRAWVDAAQEALASDDPYRIAETARQVSANIPGEVFHTSELENIYEWLGQANIAGQHMESALGQGDDKLYKESKGEFASIVHNIDAVTRGWK